MESSRTYLTNEKPLQTITPIDVLRYKGIKIKIDIIPRLALLLGELINKLINGLRRYRGAKSTNKNVSEPTGDMLEILWIWTFIVSLWAKILRPLVISVLIAPPFPP
jgi:hypothetical protein